MPTPPRRWACIFTEEVWRNHAAPRLQKRWRQVLGREPNYAGLIKIWRDQHCYTLNRWGSMECPYAKADCAQAFLAVVELTLDSGYKYNHKVFAGKAKDLALDRLDTKPLARDNRTDVSPRSGIPGAPDQGANEGRGLRRSTTGPIRIGELLRKIDVRPHQGPPENGEEGTQ